MTNAGWYLDLAAPQAVPVYASTPAVKQQRGPVESASRGFALRVTGAPLGVGGFLIIPLSGGVAALNWMLFIRLLLVLAAITIGIIGVVFLATRLTRNRHASGPAARSRRSHTLEDHRPCTIGSRLGPRKSRPIE